MSDPVWKVTYCEYKAEDKNQVKVADLHWEATLAEGDLKARRYGSAMDNHNRVYSLPALQQVPKHVMIKWAHQAIEREAKHENGQTVDQIEQSLRDDINRQKTPDSGGLVP